jgi:hypothetical protein
MSSNLDRIRELTEDLQLTDVLAAEKPAKEVNFSEKLISKELEDIKKNNQFFDEEEEDEDDPEYDDGFEDDEPAAKDKGVGMDADLTAETIMILYDGFLSGIGGHIVANRFRAKMSEEDWAMGAYYDQMDDSKLDKEQKMLVGRYREYNNEANKMIEKLDLTDSEKKQGFRILELLAKNGKIKMKPEWGAAITFLQQIGSRAVMIYTA